MNDELTLIKLFHLFLGAKSLQINLGFVNEEKINRHPGVSLTLFLSKIVHSNVTVGILILKCERERTMNFFFTLFVRSLAIRCSVLQPFTGSERVCLKKHLQNHVHISQLIDQLQDG